MRLLSTGGLQARLAPNEKPLALRTGRGVWGEGVLAYFAVPI